MVEARLARQFSRQRHVAGSRQPAEFDREQEDQHDPEPEIRCRDAPQREQIGAVVPGRAFLHRRDDAGGNADQEGDHDRHRRQLHRHRQFLRDQLAHRHLDAQRLAEVAGQHALDPVDVLHRNRLIEPVLLADLGDDLGIAFLAGHHQRRIAGQQLLQREDQDRHEEQRRDQLQDALGEEVQHGAARFHAQRMRATPRCRTVAHLRSRCCASAEQRKIRCAAPERTKCAVQPLTSASARPRAPARPASACSLRAWWCARSICLR